MPPVDLHDYKSDTIHFNNIQAWQFGYIGVVAPNTTPENSAYLKRVAKKWDGVDTFQTIKVVTTYGQFIDTYERLLSKSDGMVADFNNALLLKVFPDAARHPWVLLQVDALKKKYAALRQKALEDGYRLLLEHKRSILLDNMLDE
ncbi:hypothetical protein BUE76_10675 [Cnuella takakiae]|nr:hypothetical protein BUE76_10675 [Cnuella takakiae]